MSGNTLVGSSISAFITAVLFLFNICSYAQVTTGMLSGRVTDEEGKPVWNTVISVKGQSVQGSITFKTDELGNFKIKHLIPSDSLDVLVEKEGYNTVLYRKVIVRADQDTTLNVVLSTERTQITISGSAMSIRQTDVTMTIPEKEIKQLPVLGEFSDRSYQSLLYFTPTATHSRLAGNPAMGGATGIENVYMIDGIITNDPVEGVFGTNLNIAFFSDMNTEVYGVEASNPSSTGGFFNLITRSGSNDFHGNLSLWTTQRGMTARENSNDFEITEGRPWRVFDAAFDMGGPIIKDRLWFYIGINPYYKIEEDRGSDILRHLYQDRYQVSIPYAFDKKTNTATYIGKLTWRINAKHSLEFTAFGDPSRQRLFEGISPTLFPISRESRRSVGSTNIGLKWFATISPDFFFFANIAFTHRRNDLKPWLSGQSGYSVPLIVNQDFDQDLVVSKGFGQYTFDDRDTRQVRFNGTWIVHTKMPQELSFGMDMDNMLWKQVSDYTGRYFYQARKQEGTDPTQLSSYREVYRYYFQNPRLREKERYTALFAQDRFFPNEDLTLILGMRYEINYLKSQYGNSLKLNSLSPRFGIAWDVFGNDKSKLYGFAGRYYERVPLYLAKSLEANHASYKDVYVDGSLSSHTVFNQDPAMVLNGVKNQSQDEFVLGLSYELPQQIVIDGRFVYRKLNNLLETVGFVNPATGSIDFIVMNPGDQQPPLLETWKGLVPGYETFPNPKRKYSAFELSLEKRLLEHWFFNGSYTLSRLEGNTAAGYDRSLPQLAPNATTEWDIPSSIWIRNRYGLLPTDRTHQIKVLLGYRFDFGFTVGGSVRFDTGRPIDKIDSWPKKEFGYGNLFVTPRGSEGRLPSALTLNLHLEYALKIKKNNLNLFADVVNLLNSQVAFRVEETYYEKRAKWSDPKIINPDWSNVRAYTDPRAVGVGIKWSF